MLDIKKLLYFFNFFTCENVLPDEELVLKSLSHIHKQDPFHEQEYYFSIELELDVIQSLIQSI